MEESRKGFILTKRDLEQAWRSAQGKKTGEPADMHRYSFLDNQGSEGEERSKYIMLGMDKLEPGGGIVEHYHVNNSEMPIFDHAYYVISGRIRATMGDSERIVGADCLIYCPSNVRHSITNIGKGTAKILRIKGSGEGEKTGTVVYTKEQGRVDYWVPAKPK
jgi:mannose-6-phosphate isomerase-like protein (cupin superfamily)